MLIQVSVYVEGSCQGDLSDQVFCNPLGDMPLRHDAFRSGLRIFSERLIGSTHFIVSVRYAISIWSCLLQEFGRRDLCLE